MKLSPLTIIIMGISVFIMLFSYAFFDQYQPNKAEAKLYNDWKELLTTEENKRPMAQARVQKATELVNQSQVEWKQIVNTRTPATTVAQGGIDLGVNPWQLVNDAHLYRNSIQLAVNNQIRKGGVKLPNGGPAIPDPGTTQQQILAGFFNYPAVQFPVVIFDLGPVTVQGTYDQIIANYMAWGKMPHYMALVDGLQVTGTSPILTGTYNLQILGFIRATDNFPPAPEVLLAGQGGPAGGNGGAAGGGGGGGRGGGGGGRGGG